MTSNSGHNQKPQQQITPRQDGLERRAHGDQDHMDGPTLDQHAAQGEATVAGHEASPGASSAATLQGAGQGAGQEGVQEGVQAGVHEVMHEVSGRIKWFDTARGFGFITCATGPDVMLHAATLRREGRSSLREGAAVTCIAAQGPRGLHVVRLLAIDESDAPHPAEIEPRTRVVVTPDSDLESATVKWFNRLRGFGFVSCGEGKPDIFVHMEVARRCGMLALQPGQAVAVRYGSSARGLMATEIYPLDEAAPGLRH